MYGRRLYRVMFTRCIPICRYLILDWLLAGSRSPFNHANPPSRRVERAVVVV